MRAWAIAFALVFSHASGAQAAAVTVPAGLNPGDTYRIIFVTSTKRDATSANIADYNAFVTNAANLEPGLAGLATTWTALASTAAVNALANAGLSASDTTTPFYNTAGDFIAAGVTVPFKGLYAGNTTAHAHRILFEDGGTSNSYVWTGTWNDGTTTQSNHLGNAGSLLTNMGWANDILGGAFWTTIGFDVPTNSHSIYGISGDLTVPHSAVPEPAALALMGSALLALGVARLRRVRK